MTAGRSRARNDMVGQLHPRGNDLSQGRRCRYSTRTGRRKGSMGAEETMPPDAAVRIAAKIAAYNGERAAVEAGYRRRRLIAWGVTALSAVVFSAVAWRFPIPAREPHLAFIFAAVGVFAVCAYTLEAA